jgi:acyl dehydratase
MSAATELESPPSLARLYAQAVLSPMIPGGGGELPEGRLTLRGAEVEAERVAEYCRVCCFRVRNSVPGTYPHILAFPLHLCLMTDRSFPFSVLGLVHIANRIEALAPIPVGTSLDLSVWAEDLRPHPRGTQFDLVSEATLDGALAWRERSTYLSRGGDGNGDSAPDPGGDGDGELNVAAVWRVPGDIGRRYAAVSGDRNPIHMHSLSARLFGFPTAIAHGMWTKARCLAALEGELPDTYTVDVRFKLPIFLPSKVVFTTDTRQFDVRAAKDGKPHLSGEVTH